MSEASPSAEEERLDDVWMLLEEGRAEEALDGLEDCPRGAETAACEAYAWMLLGDLERAGAVVEEARADAGGEASPVLDWALGELHLHAWRIRDATRVFEDLVARAPSSLHHQCLATCRDLAAQFEDADRHYARATALDPEGFPPVPRLSVDQFGAVVQEAIGLLPPDAGQALENTPIVVDPVPGPDVADAPERPEAPPHELFGLFTGVSRLEAEIEEPRVIHLFQRNLERAAIDREDLVMQIGVTLLHEIGHLLGFDEEGVDELGLA